MAMSQDSRLLIQALVPSAYPLPNSYTCHLRPRSESGWSSWQTNDLKDGLNGQDGSIRARTPLQHSRLGNEI
jgi:hypothetical protein